jgi:hypothetical protein
MRCFFSPPPDHEPEEVNWTVMIVLAGIAGAGLGALIWLDPIAWVLP